MKAWFEMRLRSVSSSAVVLLEQTTQNGHLADDGAELKRGKVWGIIFPAGGDGRSEQSPCCICRPQGRNKTVFELLRLVGKKSCLSLRFSRN